MSCRVNLGSRRDRGRESYSPTPRHRLPRLSHSLHVCISFARVQAMGLELHVPEQFRLHSLTTIRVPEGIVAPALQGHLIANFNLEISGGLGKFAGECGCTQCRAVAFGVRDVS